MIMDRRTISVAVVKNTFSRSTRLQYSWLMITIYKVKAKKKALQLLSSAGLKLSLLKEP
jgi:hypothetical protein